MITATLVAKFRTRVVKMTARVLFFTTPRGKMDTRRVKIRTQRVKKGTRRAKIRTGRVKRGTARVKIGRRVPKMGTGRFPADLADYTDECKMAVAVGYGYMRRTPSEVNAEMAFGF